ncbi:MAG: hypothetical protein N2748_02825 [candidate division WOR-3 bacterium]|nr:hypothetical protein [candidate division WOR-3 bacterium]
MEEIKNQTTQLSEVIISQSQRIPTLIDMLYLINVVWLYVFSLIYPLFGIIFGIILNQASISESGKKLGRTCLILGVINIGLVIIFSLFFIFLSGFLSRFIPNSI